jgi:hypothetical protein
MHQRAAVVLPQEKGGLHERAMLVALTVGKWGISRDENGALAEIMKAGDADPAMMTLRKKLIRRDAVKNLTHLEGALRQEHNFLTLPWDDSGYRILTNAGYFRYTEKMNDLVEKYNAAADELVENYEELKAEARKLLGKRYNEKQYPDAVRLRARYKARIVIRPITGAEDFRVQLSGTEAAVIRKQLEGEFEDQMKAAYGSIWARLSEVLTHAADRLKAYTVNAEGKVENSFRDSLVNNIKELLEVVPTLNVNNDPTVNEFVVRIQKEITQFHPDTLRYNARVRGEVIKAADDILARIQEFAL